MGFKISEVFDYFPGNHGLTEEVIYRYQPTSQGDSVPIFSGSKDNIVPVGVINKNARNNEGKDIEYFKGPCVILTKDGSAGLLTYKDQGIFTINHHACVLKTKNEWKDKIDLDWFAQQYHKKLYQYVTSKSDNCVFSTEWFDRIPFVIPNLNTQNRQKEKKQKLSSIVNSIDNLIYLIKEVIANKIIEFTDGATDEIQNIFQVKGGNSGLTEEFIYNNQPNNEEEKIAILSSATLDVNMMGYISRNARIGRKILKIFEGPCILVARNGYAGTMTYIESSEFTTNDHAYVLTPKKLWKGKIDLRWFVYQYQKLFYNLITSKSDNATFNKEYAEKQKVKIPDIKIQNLTSNKLLIVDKLIMDLERAKTEIDELIEYEII